MIVDALCARPRGKSAGAGDAGEPRWIAQIGSWWWDSATGEATWSAEMYRIFARRPELGAATGAQFLAYVHVQDRDRVAAVCAQPVGAACTLEHEYRIIRGDGTVRTVYASGRRDPRRPGLYAGTVQDVTDLREALLQARRELELAAAITNSLREGVLITRDQVIVEVNTALCELTGFTRSELVGARAPYPFWTPETVARLRRQSALVHGGGRVEVEASVSRKDGARFDALISAVVARAGDGQPLGYVCVIHDVSGQRRHEAELQRLAAQDPLTGLANHRVFHEQLANELSRAKRHARPLSVAVLDLDRFKQVNDTFGHPVGDQVLREAAERLRSLVRDGELLARLGGDEFAWILPDADRSGALLAAERARIAISASPFAHAGRLTVSAGVCELAAGGDAGQLYALADLELYRAKRGGRDQASGYNPNLRDRQQQA